MSRGPTTAPAGKISIRTEPFVNCSTSFAKSSTIRTSSPEVGSTDCSRMTVSAAAADAIIARDAAPTVKVFKLNMFFLP